MSIKIIFPPRPKGKMLPSDLSYYESSGNWIAQRKFNGSRCVIHLSKDRYVTIGNRHGGCFSRFSFTKGMIDELLSSIKLEDNKEYWLDGELMNKQQNATNEIVFYDVLQAGRYLFGSPNQAGRIEMLNEICGNPTQKCDTGVALQISKRFWMAETFFCDFSERFSESLPSNQIEGLVLRRKASVLDNFGHKEYETANLIRCRKPFSKDKGYEF